MIYEHLKQLCETNEWVFNSGDENWQNLLDQKDDTDVPFEDKQLLVLLLQEDEDDDLNEHAGVEKVVVNGSMLLACRSRITEKDYNIIKEKYIIPMKQLISPVIRDSFDPCDNMRVRKWKKIEVANLFDTTISGLKINFTIDLI